MLSEDEALLEEIALMSIDPEDARLSVLDLDDDISTTAFTALGVKNLKELLANLKPSNPPR